MRVLVGAVGSPGHLFPLLPLATALRDEGHEVAVATSQEMAATVGAAGLTLVPAGLAIGTAFARASADLGLSGPPADPEVLGNLVGRAFGDLVPRTFVDDLAPWVAQERPDLVIAEAGCPGVALAGVRAGVPTVVHAFGRVPAPDTPVARGISAGITAIAEEIGVVVEPGRRFLGHAYLDICPPTLQRPDTPVGGRVVPLRPTPWNPPTAFTDRRAEPGRRPWVYLTLGTAQGEPEVLRAAVAGLAALDVDILLAAGAVDPAGLADLVLPGRVQVEPFVPQAELMARFDLVVHHGGSGTTLAAAAAGVPQVLLPWGADQFDNAAALETAGVGRALVGPGAVTPDAVTTTAQAVRSDASRAAARMLAGEIAAMPSPADVAGRAADWAEPPTR